MDAPTQDIVGYHGMEEEMRNQDRENCMLYESNVKDLFKTYILVFFIPKNAIIQDDLI